MPLVMTLAIVLAFCGLENCAEAQDEFKYGALMPVTGPVPQYGELRGRVRSLMLAFCHYGGIDFSLLDFLLDRSLEFALPGVELDGKIFEADLDVSLVAQERLSFLL